MPSSQSHHISGLRGQRLTSYLMVSGEWKLRVAQRAGSGPGLHVGGRYRGLPRAGGGGLTCQRECGTVWDTGSAVAPRLEGFQLLSGAEAQSAQEMLSAEPAAHSVLADPALQRLLFRLNNNALYV